VHLMIGGRRLLLAAAAVGLLIGYGWWATLPRFAVTRPAEQLVLQQADLAPRFRSLAAESSAIDTNPYEDHTKHFRSGYRAEFEGAADSEWHNTRVISTSFVVDRKGAERIYAAYVESMRGRGQVQPFATLGAQSRFVVAHQESAAPTVVIGVVRVENVLITLTMMTDRVIDPSMLFDWAAVLVQRAGP
jgi:hypothetical protein